MLTKTGLPTPEEMPTSSRRNFLGKIGGAAAIAAFATACQKDLVSSKQLSSSTVDESRAKNSFGTGDVAILNYAYLLEQLEAAFYIMVTANFYSGSTDWQRRRLMQIRDHEIAHREFFKTALGPNAIGEAEFDFSSIDFTSKASVLGASQAFEDTGVAAYNGVAYKIVNPDYLLVAGKIVSVEARHAAYVKELVMENSFTDSIMNDNGLDASKPPKVVMPIIQPYLKTSMDYSGLKI